MSIRMGACRRNSIRNTIIVQCYQPHVGAQPVGISGVLSDRRPGGKRRSEKLQAGLDGLQRLEGLHCPKAQCIRILLKVTWKEAFLGLLC